MNQKPKTAKQDSIKTSLFIPIAKALGIHVLMLALLFVSFQPSVKEIAVDLQAKPLPMIKATAISSEVVKKLVEKKQQKINDAARAERDRKNRIRREADRKKKSIADKKRKKLTADKKRKADADKKKKADADKKRKADLEKKRKADADKKRRAEAEMQAQIQAEQNAARERQALSEAQKYFALIKSKISGKWIMPKQSGICILKLRLGPGGIVLDVSVVSGLPIVCSSAMAAVYKSAPLPVSSDANVFKKMRTFEIELEPSN